MNFLFTYNTFTDSKNQLHTSNSFSDKANLLGVTVKPFKMTESICCFCECLAYAKNQHHIFIESRHIADSILRIILL